MGVLKEFEPFWNKVLDNFSVDCISHIVNVKLQNVFLGISSCGSIASEPNLAHAPIGY